MCRRSAIPALRFTTFRTEDYSNPSNWRQAWTYFFREGSVVSNMISLVSGDVNQDGVDDLACTWGYYYGPQQNAGSRAVVMFGSTSAHMLQSSRECPLTYEGSNTGPRHPSPSAI